MNVKLIGCTILLTAVLMGCSVEKAMQAPTRKNLNVFQPGTSRLQLISEVGTPAVTEYRHGKRVDIFIFKQGMAEELNYLRAAGYGAAFVVTGGLSEVLTYPVESEANFPTITRKLRMTYDSVISLEVLKDGLVIKAGGPGDAHPPAPAASIAAPPSDSSGAQLN